MKLKLLLVNPPIYDFAAYDFWLKPYGMLRAAGKVRKNVQLHLFDYLDRNHPAFDPQQKFPADEWGRGSYPNVRISKPACLKEIRRYYRRFGIDRPVFQKYIAENGPFDAVLIQTVLTYWYPGVREVIEDIRRICPRTQIILGGFYATVCSEHARLLDADVVIQADNLAPLKTLGMDVSDAFRLPAWDLYPRLDVGVLKLTQGCPFQCSYCFVPQSGTRFSSRPLEECLAELELLVSLGVRNIAFYDDALLYKPETILVPFLQTVIDRNLNINFHTPNALHARFMTGPIARLMVQAGVKTFYLGFESSSGDFHRQTGSGKVVSEELSKAVEYLKNAGVSTDRITAYEMLGHPKATIQQLEQSMQFASSLGIRIQLSDFSPIPGTPDGEQCRSITDLSEPLNHNKTAFPMRFLGDEKVNYYKHLCRKLNKTIK